MIRYRRVSFSTVILLIGFVLALGIPLLIKSSSSDWIFYSIISVVVIQLSFLLLLDFRVNKIVVVTLYGVANVALSFYVLRQLGEFPSLTIQVYYLLGLYIFYAIIQLRVIKTPPYVADGMTSSDLKREYYLKKKQHKYLSLLMGMLLMIVYFILMELY